MKPLTKSDRIERLADLGFRTGPDVLRAIFDGASKKRASPAFVVEQLARVDKEERERGNLNRRMRSATLGSFKAVNRFDLSWPRVIDEDLYENPLALDFIDRGHNVLFRGQSGTGNSMLAQNLGAVALQGGSPVRVSMLAAILSIPARRTCSTTSSLDDTSAPLR